MPDPQTGAQQVQIDPNSIQPLNGDQQASPASQVQIDPNSIQPLPGQAPQHSQNGPTSEQAHSLGDNGFEDDLKGFAKGAMGTVAGLDHIVSKIPGVGQWLTTPVVGNHTSQQAIQHEQQMAQTHNTDQNFGYGGETLTEFMMGDEALKSLSMADKLTTVAKWMKIAEKSPRLMSALKFGAAASKANTELAPDEVALLKQYPKLAKLVGLGVESARAGAVQGAQTTARTGGNLREGAESAEIGALATGATGAVVGGAGEVASKLGRAGRGAARAAEVAANAPDKQTVADSIQARLAQSENDLHANYESKTQEFENRLQGATVDPKNSPIADKATEILQKPDPDDHSSVAQLKDIRGEKLDPKVRNFLENTAEGKQPLTQQDVEAASEANKNKPQILDAAGKPVESANQEPEAQDQEPHDAHSLIQWRQQVRALAAEYPIGDVNARALKRLLYDASDNNGAGGSAFDDTFSQLAAQSHDPDVVNEYQSLRNDYRNKISKYDDPVIKNLMQGKADDAAKAFIGTKNASGLPTAQKSEFNTDNLRELLGQDGLNAFSKDVFTNMMKESSDNNGFNPAKFMDTWKRVTEGTKDGFFNVKDSQSVIPSLTSDAKTAATVQKLTRLGVLGGVGTVAKAHPIGASLITALALIAGHINGGGAEQGRELLDYVANNPKTWAFFRGVGKVGDSKVAPVAAKAAAKVSSDLYNDQRTSADTTKRRIMSGVATALGGGQ